MRATRMLVIAGLSVSLPLLAQGAEIRLDGPHLLKSHVRASSLVVADLNSDGLPDIATISNDEGLLRIYHRIAERDESDEELQDFRREEVTLDRVVRAMVAVDVNGNGRSDLVMAGGEGTLAIYLQGEDGRLQKAPDVDLRATRLVTADLNRDGHRDLIAVGANRLQIVHGGPEGLDFDKPRVFFTPTSLGTDPLVLDINDDGLMDIVYLSSENREMIHVRLQDRDGNFPAEIALKTGQVRDLDAIRLNDKRDILAAVQGRTRQVVLLQMGDPVEEESDESRLLLGDPQIIGFDPDRRDNTPYVTVADVDGDGRQDMVVEMPGTASLRIVRQTETGSLVPDEFPSFRDIRSVTAWPANAGEPTPLLMLSGSEKALGVAIASAGDRFHVPFPSTLQTVGRPLAAGAPRIQGAPTLVVLEEGTESSTAILRSYPSFDAREATLGEAQELLKLEQLKEMPRSVVVADLDRDGADDLLVFYQYASPGVLRQSADGKFEILQPAGLLAGLLESTSPGNFLSETLAGLGESTVLVARDEFVRAFHLDETGTASITQQFNGRNSRAQVRTAAVANLRGSDSREVVLYDTANNVLTVYGTGNGEGAYEVIRHVDIPSAGYRQLQALDLDGDQRDELVLMAPDRMAIIHSRLLNGGLDTLDSVETPEEEGGYGLVRSISISSPNATELAALEMRRATLDLFTLEAKDESETPKLSKLRSFRVYDSEMSIAGRVNLDAAPEPRELRTADFNGDGLMDLVLMVHDFIIVYHQQPADEKT
jgi:hypothetical protein